MAEIKTGFEDDLDEDFENDDNYETPSFRDELYDHLSPTVKQFLINYFAERLVNAEAQTLRDIEQVIKDDILIHATVIPDFLYRHRTITDNDKFYDALNNFKRDPNKQFHWPENEYWYNGPEEDPDEDDLADFSEETKKIIEAANKTVEDNNNFKRFMQHCCPVIIRETQLYLERTAVSDLTILSPEGYIVVQDAISLLAEVLAENLHAITEDM